MGAGLISEEARMVFVNEKTPWRTVSYEKNAVLIRIGTDHSEGTEQFQLILNDTIVSLSALVGSTSVENKKWDVSWKVVRLFIPESLQDQKEYVLETLKEAINVYGFNYSQENIRNLEIKIFPSNTKLEDRNAFC